MHIPTDNDNTFQSARSCITFHKTTQMFQNVIASNNRELINNRILYQTHHHQHGCICGSPGYKSDIIPLRISTALLRSKCCNAELPLRAGLIHAT